MRREPNLNAHSERGKKRIVNKEPKREEANGFKNCHAPNWGERVKKQLRIEDDEPVNRGGRQALLKPKRVDCQPIASGFEEVGGC